VLRAIEESLRELPRDAAVPAPAASPDEANEPAPPDLERSLARGAPRGSIVPEGGYKSQLPDDDVLPPDVAPDPCASPESVAKMPGIVIGITLAKNLGVTLGDCMQVTSPTIGYSFSQGSIRPPIAKQFRVIATFEAGFEQYDSKLVYTDLYEAQEFYGAGDSVMGVEMKVSDIDKAKSISRAIDKMLANGLYHTMDWEELNHGLFTALAIQKLSMSAVLALITIIAVFTVVATLIMIVLEKKKEIAILKAMGATNAAILRIFVYQGGFIGVMGTALGLLLGVLVCKLLLVYAFPLDPKVYFISKLPVEMSIKDFFGTAVGAVGICLLFTVPPSLYAARLNPADGLRGQ
jgi:lipoprotein-releasing system permease protein